MHAALDENQAELGVLRVTKVRDRGGKHTMGRSALEQEKATNTISEQFNASKSAWEGIQEVNRDQQRNRSLILRAREQQECSSNASGTLS